MTSADKIQTPAEAFDEAELQHLRTWLRLSASERLEFFEEMIDLANAGGALRADHLALRDKA